MGSFFGPPSRLSLEGGSVGRAVADRGQPTQQIPSARTMAYILRAVGPHPADTLRRRRNYSGTGGRTLRAEAGPGSYISDGIWTEAV